MVTAEHPIDLCAPEVVALAAGRKRQHRVLITSANSTASVDFRAEDWGSLLWPQASPLVHPSMHGIGLSVPRIIRAPGSTTRDSVGVWPRWCVGDVLWVREAWDPRPNDGVRYAANLDGSAQEKMNWQSRRTLRRARARITMRITDLRPERIADITREGILAEGIEPLGDALGWYHTNPRVHHRAHQRSATILRDGFASQWCAMRHNTTAHRNCPAGACSWQRNDWVWVLAFDAPEVSR